MYYLNQQICFLCLTYNQNDKYLDNDYSSVQEKLQYFIPTQILLKFEIPKHVCEDCLENLQRICSFRDKCIENIEIFNDYVQKLAQQCNSFKYLSVSLTDILQFEKPQLLQEIQNNIKNENERLNSDTKTENEILKTDNNEFLIINRVQDINKEHEKVEHIQLKFEHTIDDIGIKKEINEELIIDDNFCIPEFDLLDLCEIDNVLPGYSDQYGNEKKVQLLVEDNENFVQYSILSSDSDEEIDVVSIDEEQITIVPNYLPPSPSVCELQETSIRSKRESVLPLRFRTNYSTPTKRRRGSRPGAKRGSYLTKRRESDSCDNSYLFCPKKQIMHNDKERQRRGHLRNAFHDLRILVPEVSLNERAAKVNILLEAAAYCNSLTRESQGYQRQISTLRLQQKKLKAWVASLAPKKKKNGSFH